MENYFMAILKLLNVIHWENKVIVSCMLDKEKSKDICEKMDKILNDVIDDFNNMQTNDTE